MRKLTLTLKRKKGTIEELHAWVNGEKVIRSTDLEETPEWAGDVGDGKARVKVKAIGVGRASYEVGIDLPGTANDQSIELVLAGGYHETVLEI
jgi:hypothetical protein